MNIELILSLNDPAKVIDTFKALNSDSKTPEENRIVYDGKHSILSKPDKPIKDEKNRIISTEVTAKTVLNYQKKITESSVVFLVGKPIKIIDNSENYENLKILKEALKEANFDSKCKKNARNLFIETKTAVLYYIKKVKDFSTGQEEPILASRILCKKNGDDIYVNRNDYGDVDSLLRIYKSKILENGNIKVIDNAEIYTAEKTYFFKRGTSGSWALEAQDNPIKMLPAVYYDQDSPEWSDVETIISNQEKNFSKLHDTNIYFASPTLKTKGKVKGLPKKDDDGKVLALEGIEMGDRMEWADASYLTWDQRPESLKMEFDMNHNFIMNFTYTADLSAESLKDKNMSNLSGVALELLLTEPIQKSQMKQEDFYGNLLREVKIAAAFMGVIKNSKTFREMKLDIKFTSSLPKNLVEMIDMLSQATGADPILSQETAIELNPMVDDSQREKDRLREDETRKAGSFNLNQ